jgi:alpha-ketoglutarate-dependent taurine dioxygenase
VDFFYFYKKKFENLVEVSFHVDLRGNVSEINVTNITAPECSSAARLLDSLTRLLENPQKNKTHQLKDGDRLVSE